MLAIQTRLVQAAPVSLQVDPGVLSDSERGMLPLLFAASRAMDAAFWRQTYGDRAALFAAAPDEPTRRYARINYGPWDRLRGDEPFIDGFGAKPPGANFYPADLGRAEYESARAADLALGDLYTMLRRDTAGRLQAIPYSRFFAAEFGQAAGLLRRAAALAADAGLRAYLELRAQALLDDDYRPSDTAWMDMRDNTLDMLIGPMEVSEDRLFWSKAACAATLLVKDWHWTRRLEHLASLLTRFQERLPVPAAYKGERPGLESEIGVYDALSVAGYDNASVPLGVSWPNDDEVRLSKGTRSLQIRNLMRAKFEKLLLPLADFFLEASQRPAVTFDAFFDFVLFHELGHALGLRRTINGRGPVQTALGDQAHVIEEAKADVLGLLVGFDLAQSGDLSPQALHDLHVTALVNVLRQYDSRQARLRLNYFSQRGAYTRTRAGMYMVDVQRACRAAAELAAALLRIQGDGDLDAARALLEGYAAAGDDLQADMARFEAGGRPLEIVLVQAENVLA